MTDTNKKTRKYQSKEDRVNNLINMAMAQAEQQLANGTASSQIVTHFLNLGSERFRYELERLQAETELAKARQALIDQERKQEELLDNAIRAFSEYSGDDE